MHKKNIIAVVLQSVVLGVFILLAAGSATTTPLATSHYSRFQTTENLDGKIVPVPSEHLAYSNSYNINIPIDYLFYQQNTCTSLQWCEVCLTDPKGKNYKIHIPSWSGLDSQLANNTYTYENFLVVDLQSVVKGQWHLRLVQKNAGHWFYMYGTPTAIKSKKANPPSTILDTSLLVVTSDLSFPTLTNPSSWIKKKGYTIMHNVPVVDINHPDESYCILYVDGQGVYEGYYRTGYAAQKDTWYIVDLGHGKGYACLTAGYLYNMTPQDYVAARQNVVDIPRKTIWLGQEYSTNTKISDAQLIKIFKSTYGLQSNKTGTKKIEYTYEDRVWFPAVDLMDGYGYYTPSGRAAARRSGRGHPAVFQGDFYYYGSCTANFSITGWTIKDDSVVFRFSKPTPSPKFYIDPTRWVVGWNCNETAKGINEFQDEMALQMSNVDNEFRRKFRATLKDKISKKRASLEQAYKMKIVEIRPNSLIYEQDGDLCFQSSNQDKYPDPACTYQSYNPISKSKIRQMFATEMTHNIRNLIKTATDVCIVKFDLQALEMLVLDEKGNVYDCTFAITQDANKKYIWNLIDMIKCTQYVEHFEQFNKNTSLVFAKHKEAYEAYNQYVSFLKGKNRKLYRQNYKNIPTFETDYKTKWKNWNIVNNAYTLEDLVVALQMFPQTYVDQATMILFLENYIERSNLAREANTLSSQFKKQSTLVFDNDYIWNWNEDMVGSVENLISEVSICRDYVAKGKSANAKKIAKLLRNVKTKDDVMRILELQKSNTDGDVNAYARTIECLASVNDIPWMTKYSNRQQDEVIYWIMKLLEL